LRKLRPAGVESFVTAASGQAGSGVV
jgi:hypothetical protein